jgi:alkylhydroperoxidase family enzyme
MRGTLGPWRASATPSFADVVCLGELPTIHTKDLISGWPHVGSIGSAGTSVDNKGGGGGRTIDRKTVWRTDAMSATSNVQADSFLAPIEEPAGLIKRLMYAVTRRQFGKVLTPVKVVYARLPMAFGLFSSKISKLDKKLSLPPETGMLIRERVARLNVCLFCIDIGRSLVIKESMNEAKFDALDEYHTSSLFTDAERAALDYVTELTTNKQMDRNTFERMAAHYSERQICEIVWLVASEHYYNITNIGLNIHSDMLCDISRRKKSGQNIRT